MDVEIRERDKRDVPPLGYCIDCAIRGHWIRATFLQNGAGLCAEDLLEHRSAELIDDQKNLLGKLRGDVERGDSLTKVV